FWGDDKNDRFRIRFIGDVPNYIDHTKKKRKRLRRDRYADDENRGGVGAKQGMPQKRAFDEHRPQHFRDIVIIEADGSFKVNGSVYAYKHFRWSDARLKEGVRPIQRALDKVNAMRGISYRWRAEEMEDALVDDRRQLGVVAQEIEKVCPEVVSTEKVGDVPTKTVDYTQLVPVLIEAIKEQQALIDKLRLRLEALEGLACGESTAAPKPPKTSAPSPSRKRSSKRCDA
ncbi:MAG TPA: tail fiber domain-containing protein, partial [Polyangium sp.]|nr:tail fiber domain-containing protein [Polyangium sp.]